MFNNYLLTAVRLLLKNKLFSFINITGLAVGTLCCLYILLYIDRQSGYDRHHQQAADIFRVTSSVRITGDVHHGAAASPPVGPALQQDFPEVLQTTRVVSTHLMGVQQHLLRYKEQSFYERQAMFADSSFFDVFTYRFIRGDAASCLKAPYTVVLLKPVADKLFGREDPLGKMIQIDNAYGKHDLTVTGVVDGSRGTSHLQARLFMTLNSGGIGQYVLNDQTWAGNNFVHTYVKFRPNTHIAAFEEKLPGFLHKYGQQQLANAGMKKELHLQPITAIHTTPGYEFENCETISPAFLKVLLLIAMLVQLVACINFMNLSTAHASRRAKEVGVRKVTGAGRINLIQQFLTESFLLSLAGVLIAVPLLVMLLPVLNHLTGADIQASYIADRRVMLLLAALTTGTGLIAGSYPAFYLSAFKVIRVIKGNFTSHLSAGNIRRLLVVGQFTVSILLIIGIIVIYSQLQFIRSRDLGFEQDQKLVFHFYTNDTKQHAPAFADALGQLPGIREVSKSNSYPSQLVPFERSFYLPGGNATQAHNAQFIHTDEHFTRAMGIEVVAGRNFRMQDSGKVLINEAMARQLGLDVKKAAGMKLYSTVNAPVTDVFEVAGVMKDFNYNSLHKRVQPLLLQYDPYGGDLSHLVVAANSTNYQQLLQQMEQLWHKYLPATPFDYSFLDSEVQRQYQSEITLARIINAFSIITILISCLGLFGLAAFNAEQRSKEIGIRKVLGASVPDLVHLLSKDFLRLVAISFIIATPVAWWCMHKWLDAFAYRVTISWWMFTLAGMVALLIALVTVSFQAIKSALANPVKSLKSE